MAQKSYLFEEPSLETVMRNPKTAGLFGYGLSNSHLEKSFSSSDNDGVEESRLDNREFRGFRV